LKPENHTNFLQKRKSVGNSLLRGMIGIDTRREGKVGALAILPDEKD
jgi:hypothetical protein